jgi:hypothetical protein
VTAGGMTAVWVSAGGVTAAAARLPLALALVLATAAWSVALAQDPAQAWSVQVIALRDLRDAQSTAEDLRELGFPAYTEFAMSDGQQWVRVRVGCWLSRDGTEAMAEVLRGLTTAEAVAVPLSPEAEVPCVDVDVGFLKPSRFMPLHLGGELPTYRVEVADHVAHVRHDGDRWLVIQGDVEPEPTEAPAGTLTYRSGEIRGFAVVLLVSDGVATVFCPGRLVAQAVDVAVVEWENAIVACMPLVAREARLR